MRFSARSIDWLQMPMRGLPRHPRRDRLVDPGLGLRAVGLRQDLEPDQDHRGQGQDRRLALRDPALQRRSPRHRQGPMGDHGPRPPLPGPGAGAHDLHPAAAGPAHGPAPPVLRFPRFRARRDARCCESNSPKPADHAPISPSKSPKAFTSRPLRCGSPPSASSTGSSPPTPPATMSSVSPSAATTATKTVSVTDRVVRLSPERPPQRIHRPTRVAVRTTAARRTVRSSASPSPTPKPPWRSSAGAGSGASPGWWSSSS